MINTILGKQLKAFIFSALNRLRRWSKNKPEKSDYLKILIINPYGLGDLIFSLALVKKLYTNVKCSIDIVTSLTNYKFTKELIYFNEVCPFDRKNVFKNIKLLLNLWRKREYQYAILCYPNQYFVTLFLAVVSRAAIILGHNHKELQYKKFHKILDNTITYDFSTNVAIENLKLIEMFNFGDTLPPDFPWIELKRHIGKVVEVEKNDIAIHPGTAPSLSLYKRWPIEKFVSLIKILQQKSYSLILIIGPAEEALYNIICKRLNHNINRTPANCSIIESIEHVKSAKCFIGHDSGFSHIVNALNIPSINIYGSTDYKRVSIESAKRKIISKKLECQPCFRKSKRVICKYEEPKCLTELDVEEVIFEIEKMVYCYSDCISG